MANMRHASSSAVLVVALAVVCHEPAAAQEVPQNVDDAPSGEIIVTATREARPMSRVPVSVSAYSQETMDVKSVRSIGDVARFTPGITFNPVSNAISIRGISSAAGAGTTGIYIDDTPVQIRGLGVSSEDSLPAVFDLERVEVLRGPQGTLFGAGSEGGTVRYITPQPGLSNYSAYGRAEIAATAHGGLSYEGGVAVGGPIVQDQLGFRISAWHRRDGGYIDHIDNATGDLDEKDINRGDVTVARAAVALKVGDLLMTPSVQYQRRTARAQDSYFVGISNPDKGEFRTSTPAYRGRKDVVYLPALNVQYDFGPVKMISNTSYYHRANVTGYDGTISNLTYYQTIYRDNCTDCSLYPFLTATGINRALPYYASPARITNTQRSFTQEVRFQSNNTGARLNWVAGIFYQRTRQRSTEETVDPLGNAFFQATLGFSLEDYFGYSMFGEDSYINSTSATEEQVAGFADLTYAVTDRLKLTVGGRYARTKFSFTNFADGAQNSRRTTGQGSSSENPFTPKAGVTFQITPDDLLYATWSKGFRAGGTNQPVPVDVCRSSLDALGLTEAPSDYKSDRVRSIELGSKNKLLDRKLVMAASVYDIQWTNIQQAVYLPVCAIQYIDNLGAASSRGFDLQLTATPLKGLTIDAAIGYSHVRYTRSSSAAVRVGDAIEGAPWTVSMGAQQNFRLGGTNVFVRSDVQYQSQLEAFTPTRNPLGANYDPALVPPSARTFVGLRAGAELGRANLSLFVDNLLDAAPIVTQGHTGPEALLFTQTTLRPRTIGLTLTYRQ